LLTSKFKQDLGKVREKYPVNFSKEGNAFQIEFSRQRSTLSENMIGVIRTHENLYRGALGPHLVEGYFRLVQRLQHGDHAPANLAPCCHRALVMNLLILKLGQCLTNPNVRVIRGQIHE
jgi:hypothetical protein